MNKRIAQVVVGLPVEGPFDYLIPADLFGKVSVGHRVEVPFGFRRLVGYVVGLRSKSKYTKLKSIIALLDNFPLLDQGALDFARAFAQRYGCSLGEAIESGLPRALRQKKPCPFEGTGLPAADGGMKSANAVLCYDKGQNQSWPFILESVGKTLAQNRNVLFLVPEKYFLMSILEILEKHFPGAIALLDKRLSAQKELKQWGALRKGEYRLAIGTRSAVFTPLAQLGLIIVYEESHPAYKQEQSPFYHVREVAFMRAGISGCDLLFVDHAPSVELWAEVKRKKVHKVTFEAGPMAELKLVDLNNYKSRRLQLLSFPLQNSINDVLNRKGRVLLFYNRRGFSTLVRCNQCGYSVRCPRCDVPLTYLYSKKKLVCSLCHHSQELPQVCPGCQKSYLRYLGTGVEKIESEIARAFPQARISRFDSETALLPPNADIVIATQAIFKVLEQNTWDVIGLLDVDSQLNRVDFRASHKVFSLVRRLRQAAKEKLFIQTFHPGHYALKAAQRNDCEKFYGQELKFRRECHLPPFCRMAAVCLRGSKKEEVFTQTTRLFEKLKQDKTAFREVMEPQPDFLPKLRDKYRFIIMIKDKSLKKTLPLIKKSLGDIGKKGKIITTINVDP